MLSQGVVRGAYNPDTLSDDLLDLVAEYESLFREDYAGIEETITLKAERVELPESLLPWRCRTTL